MRYYLSVISFFIFVNSIRACTSNVVQFKIKEHSKEADLIRTFLSSVHDFCITDSVALVYFKDNHSETYTVVSEGENRMFYLLNREHAYFVNYTSAFKDVQFIIDNSESHIHASVVFFDQIQFDCNGSISICKGADFACIESRSKGGCIHR